MAIAELPFKVISQEQASKLKKTGGNRYSGVRNPLVEALTKGERIIVDVDDGKKIAGLYESARKKGFKLTANKIFLPDDKGEPTEKQGYLLFFTEKPEGE